MALNPSGAISLGGTTAGQSIELENGGPGTVQISLNDTAVRSLAGPAFATTNTTIQMPTDFWGKSNLFSFTVSGTDVNLRTAAISAGWPGSGAVSATVPSANTIQASTTGTYALTINGSWPGGVTLNNQGVIQGRGGDGGTGGPSAPASAPSYAGFPGSNAGTALLVSVPVTINNTGSINGGGGGGGGGSATGNTVGPRLGGGGGGGGGGIGVSSGGAGGSGRSGGNPGGAGNPGTLTVFGTGGAGGNASATPAATGGAGGTYGSAGSVGGTGAQWGIGGGAAGAAGGAVSGNPFITWSATGTRNGPIV
jgi:hypothetical protein